jgi:hypothetical protein
VEGRGAIDLQIAHQERSPRIKLARAIDSSLGLEEAIDLQIIHQERSPRIKLGELSTLAQDTLENQVTLFL